MNDARRAFHDLQDLSGELFADADLDATASIVRRRTHKRRVVAGAVASLAAVSVAAVGYGAFALTSATGPDRAGPAAKPSSPVASTVAPSPSVSTALRACNEATVVPGKPVGDLGGLEGWFNSTPTVPCDEWEVKILEHPDTVLIYTGDNTVVEAYYRTSVESLGIYADLDPDFAVPEPDPSWPEDSLILIDARTGELLETHDSNPVTDLPVIDATLVDDSSALAERLDEIGSGQRAAPQAFVVDSVASGPGTEADLVTPIFLEPGPGAGAPGAEVAVVIRLVPGNGTVGAAPDSSELASGFLTEHSVLFQGSDPVFVQASIAIGDDATLMIVGSGDAASPSVVTRVAQELLASD